MNAIMTLGLSAIRSEIYLCAAALFLLLYGAYRAPKADVTLVLGGVLVLALAAFLSFDGGMEQVRIFSGMFVSNAFTVTAKILIATASILVLMLATDWLEGRPFEYVVLVLFATLGMMLMVSSGSLLALYMSLEMMSLPLYVLASFDRDGARSTEAGLKYFVLGSVASGMILFGMSLIYGFAGTVRFDALTEMLIPAEAVSHAVVVGVVFVLAGFCFKISAAPFHMWTPDVYEGAPTPVAAFFATAPKVAAIALLTRLLYEPFAGVFVQWQQVLVAASLLSMLVGSLAAIVQTNIKRLLAYSSIGHMGFVLMGLTSGTLSGVHAVLVYLVLYVFMSVGTFGCVLISGREEIKDFSGLAKTHPLLAAALSACMFSMAGIPPLSGFFAKMSVLLSAVNAEMIWFAMAGLLASLISCYYYLKVVKVMYFDEPSAASVAVKASPLVVGATAIGVLVTLFYFLMPSPVIAFLGVAASALVP